MITKDVFHPHFVMWTKALAFKYASDKKSVILLQMYTNDLQVLCLNTAIDNIQTFSPFVNVFD